MLASAVSGIKWAYGCSEVQYILCITPRKFLSCELILKRFYNLQKQFNLQEQESR